MANEKTQVRPDLSIRAFLLPKISREGWPAVAVAFIIFLLFSGSDLLGSLALAAAVFTFYFFRDPERHSPDAPGAILSPADGIALPIVESTLPEELKAGPEKYVKISIFMSVFNVHVNRNPVSGRVVRVSYVEGKFFNADLDKASKDNERNIILVETPSRHKICYVQIAGLVARRIVSWLKIGDDVRAGERFGLIKFGSRLDVYIPGDKYDIRVKSGQSMVAGETILAMPKR